MITAGGWARSGKGTSMLDLKIGLEAIGVGVMLIDQGLKFRAMARVALDMGEPLDSPTTLGAFLGSDATQREVLTLLDRVSRMNEVERRACLYGPEMTSASGKPGRVKASHTIAIGLLEAEVRQAVEAETDVLLIDGRQMEDYARAFARRDLGRFVMGWFFKCDPVVAARRSLGIVAPSEELTLEQKALLFDEAVKISDRNRSDMLRGADLDPLREPTRAYRVDLAAYGTLGDSPLYGHAHNVRHGGAGMALVDTSYTSTVEEMTGPVTAISMMSLYQHGPLLPEDVGMRVARSSEW